jgi:predicted acylesterase/phospholipase RssA
MEKTEISIVLSGGGIKGLMYCGILKAYQELLYDKLYKTSQVIGVSIGSIFGLFFILGFSWIELEQDLLNLDFNMLNEFDFELLFTKYGLNTGNAIIDQVQKMMEKKGFNKNTTLLQLYNHYNIEFAVITTNLNYNNLEYISCKKYPNIKVLDAIRMAISIPLIFTAKKFNGNIHIDAGLVCNYPINFIMEHTTNKDVFGINIERNKEILRINHLSDFIKCLFKCMRNNNIDKKCDSVKTLNLHCDITDELVYGNFTTKNLNEYIDLGYNTFMKSFFL